MGAPARLTLPPALRPGDLIAVAAPGSTFDRAAFLHGADLLAARGYALTWREDIFSRAGTFAGDDERRARELDAWLRDPAVKAVLIARGGYGTSRILDRVDFAALRRRPRIVAGFSDVTALLLAVTQRSGLAAFHGPMVASAGKGRAGARDMARLLNLLEGRPGPRAFRDLRPVRPGCVRAPLAGGNLSLLAHSIGTPFEVETRGRILFVEEVNEAPYRIDRSVRQLLLAGKFKSVAGVVLGSFTGIARSRRPEVERLFVEAVGDRRVPIVAGFPAGHGGRNRPFPLGVPATLDAAAGTLLFDPCVATGPRGRQPRPGTVAGGVTRSEGPPPRSGGERRGCEGAGPRRQRAQARTVAGGVARRGGLRRRGARGEHRRRSAATGPRRQRARG